MSRAWFRSLLTLLFCYYACRLVYLAFAVRPGIPPDELTHLGLAGIYAAEFFPADSDPTHQLGLVTHVPYLYHLVCGLLLRIKPAGILAVHFLRLANVTLSLLAVAAGIRAATLLGLPRSGVLLFTVIVTNLPMQTFLAFAVSYDNLTNCLAGLTILQILAAFRSSRFRWGWFLATLAAGALAKVSFLPLALIAAALAAVARLGGRARSDSGPVAAHGWIGVAARMVRVAVAAILVLAACKLYGGNLVRYRAVIPSCEKVLPLEACLANRIYARNYILEQYRKGRISYQDAILMVPIVRHRGDQAHLRRLIEFERSRRAAPGTTWSIPRYVAAAWRLVIVPTLAGIQAHISILKPPLLLLPYHLLAILVGVLVARLPFRAGPKRPERLALLTLVLGYTSVVLLYVGYRTYLATGAPFLGIQGRYLLPVLTPAALLAADGLTSLLGGTLRLVAVLIISALLLLLDFPWLLHAMPEVMRGLEPFS